MLHKADQIEHPEEHFQSLLKKFSTFKISIFYDYTIGLEYFPEYFGIMRINCGKIIVFSLDNQIIEHFMNTFVTNIVFQHVVLSWIIKSNQKLIFCFQLHSISWLINGSW